MIQYSIVIISFQYHLVVNMNGDLMYTKVLGTSSSCNIDATRVDMVEIQGARQDQSNRY